MGRTRAIRGFLPSLLLVCAAGQLRAQVPAAPDTTPEPAIIELRLGRLVARTVQAYQVGREALVPLGQFMDLAEIHAELDSGGVLRAVMEPGHVPVSVDPAQLRATYGRRTLTLTAAEVRREAAELYLSARQLGALLDLSIDVDWGELQVVVRDPASLPVAIRLARESARAALRRGTAEVMPELVLGGDRRPLGGFVLDYSVFSPSNDLFGGATYSLAAGADVGGGSLEVGLQSEGPASSGDVRLDASWLGVWRNRTWLRQLRVGDGFGSGPTPRAIRGVYVSNAPYLRPSLISDVAYAGRLPPGWQLEAYRNGVLVGVDSVRANGSYSVELPVLYGENPVDFVAYGPFGERREFSRKYLVPSDLLPPGRFEYGLSAGQCRLDQCSAAANVDLRAGVTRKWTLGAGMDRFWRDTLPDLFHPYLNAVGTLADAWTVGGDAVLNGLLRARLSYEPTLDLRIGAEWTRFDRNAVQPILNPLHRRSQLLVNGFWRPDTRRNFLYIDGRLDYSTSASGSVLESRTGVSIGIGPVRAVPYVRLEQTRLTDSPASTNTFGGFDLFAVPGASWGALFRQLWVRASLEAESRGTVETSALTVARALTSELRLEGGVSWTRGSGGATWTLALSTAMPELRAYTQVTAPPVGPVGATQSVQGSVLYDNSAHAIAFDAGPAMQRGGLAGRVFLDENGNGRLDPGESGLANVRVQVGNSSAFSDSAGEYRVWDIVPFEPVLVTVDSLSFDSPLWVPGFVAAAAYPVPNALTRVDVPIRLGAVLEGSVVRGQDEGVGGVPLLLTDRATGRHRTITTFSDGTFYALGITSGDWELAVAPATLRLLDLAAEPLRFTVPPGAGEIPKLVIRLTPRP